MSTIGLMDANQQKITIKGRDWPVLAPTSGQLMGIAMLGAGGVGAEQVAMLTMKLILKLLPDEEARSEFVSEFIDGNYEVEHLMAVIKSIANTAGEATDEASPEPQPARKRAAAKTAARKRPQ